MIYPTSQLKFGAFDTSIFMVSTGAHAIIRNEFSFVLDMYNEFRIFIGFSYSNLIPDLNFLLKIIAYWSFAIKRFEILRWHKKK